MADVNYNLIDSMFGDSNEETKQKYAEMLRSKLKENPEQQSILEEIMNSTNEVPIPTEKDINNFQNVSPGYLIGKDVANAISEKYNTNPLVKIAKGGTEAVEEGFPILMNKIGSGARGVVDVTKGLLGAKPSMSVVQQKEDLPKINWGDNTNTDNPTEPMQATSATNTKPEDIRDKIKESLKAKKSSSNPTFNMTYPNMSPGKGIEDSKLEDLYAKLEALSEAPQTTNKDYLGAGIAAIGDAIAYGINREWKPKFDANDWFNNLIKHRQVPVENAKDLTKMKIEAALQNRKLANEDKDLNMKAAYYASEANKNNAETNYYLTGGKTSGDEKKAELKRRELLDNGMLYLKHAGDPKDKIKFKQLEEIAKNEKLPMEQRIAADNEATDLAKFYGMMIQKNMGVADDSGLFSSGQTITNLKNIKIND